MSQERIFQFSMAGKQTENLWGFTQYSSPVVSATKDSIKKRGHKDNHISLKKGIKVYPTGNISFRCV